MRESVSHTGIFAAFGAHAARERAALLLRAWPILALLFLGVAFWNGFPLVFYDTGAYLAEGLAGAFLVERSPVYSAAAVPDRRRASACGRW